MSGNQTVFKQSSSETDEDYFSQGAAGSFKGQTNTFTLLQLITCLKSQGSNTVAQCAPPAHSQEITLLFFNLFA